ncbi:MAG: hypothetical protein AAGJ50_15350 [Pseudomonadota bacterium]
MARKRCTTEEIIRKLRAPSVVAVMSGVDRAFDLKNSVSPYIKHPNFCYYE